jgi:hypothetical protein
MMGRFFFIIFAVTFFVTPVLANEYAKNYCTVPESARDAGCLEVPSGESWESLFPDANYRLLVQKLNRQNTDLKKGQWLILPIAGKSWLAMSPFSREFQRDQGQPLHLIVFDPKRLAWAHYEDGKLKWWGPAVGGQDGWHTNEGKHFFTEVAGPGRKSNLFPENTCQSGGYCAPMPYFTRFTARGQGFHERNMAGENASHGCIGVFADEAQYINALVRQLSGAERSGYLTAGQIENAKKNIVLEVLAY